MVKDDNLFYASDVNVPPKEIEKVKVSELDPERVGLIVEEKLKSLLIKEEEKVDPEKVSFPEDWFACSNCGNVFEVKRGNRVECSGCGYYFVNKDGALIVVEVLMEEEEEDGELIEEEEVEEEEDSRLEFLDLDEIIDFGEGEEDKEEKEGEEEEERSELDKIFFGEERED